MPSHCTQKTVGTVTGNKNVIPITSKIGEESTCVVVVVGGGGVEFMPSHRTHNTVVL